MDAEQVGISKYMSCHWPEHPATPEMLKLRLLRTLLLIHTYVKCNTHTVSYCGLRYPRGARTA